MIYKWLLFSASGATGKIINHTQQNTYSAELYHPEIHVLIQFGPISLTAMLMRTSILFPRRIFINLGKSQSK